MLLSLELENFIDRCTRKSIDSAGERYSPGVDPLAPNLEITRLELAMSALRGGERYRAHVRDVLDEIVKAHKDVGRKRVKGFRFELGKPKKIIELLESIATVRCGETINRPLKLRKLANNKLNHLASLRARLERFRVENNSQTKSTGDFRRTDPERELTRVIYEYESALNEAAQLEQSAWYQLFVDPFLVLYGEWGTGKTHLLCDMTRRLKASGDPCLLLLAKNFDPAPCLLSSISAHIGTGEGFQAILAKLDEQARSKNTRALMIVDGINESGKAVWQSQLQDLRKAVAPFRNVALVLSCRSPYQRWFPSSGEQCWGALEHRGLEGIEYDAQSAFFQFHNIPTPEVPLLAEEFRRPLTLKVLCKAFKSLTRKKQKQGFAGISSGQKGMTFILERFVVEVGKIVESRHGLGPKFCWKLIKSSDPTLGLAGLMVRDLRDFVLVSDCIQLIQNVHGGALSRARAEDIYESLLGEGLLMEHDWALNGYENELVPVVRMPYERFADHIVARAMLDKYLDTSNEKRIRGSFYRNRPLGKLFDVSLYGDYGNSGWVEAIILEFPEMIKRYVEPSDRELFFYLPRRVRSQVAYFEPFVEGIVWRHPESISKQTDALVSYYLENCEESARNRMLNQLLALSTKAKHPYNADRLYGLLNGFSMTERDLYWSEFIRHSSEGDTVDRTLGWLDNNPTITNREGAINLIRTLSMLLTTTRRAIRDKATKSLVLIGEQHPVEIMRLTISSFSFNDIYVPERMLAAVYGVVMSQGFVKENKAFQKELPVFSRWLVKHLFSPGGEFLTSHVLIRSYALGIIELARITHDRCISTRVVRHINPPFSSVPSVFSDASTVTPKQQENAEDAIHMDFGNYTLGRLVRSRSNYDFKNPDYIEIRKKIDGRLWDLGYRKEMFFEVDSSISRYGGVSRMPDGNNTDRYGKKYSWIAYFELYGERKGLGLLDEDRACERLSDADIDPSFPELPNYQSQHSHEWKSCSVSEWLRSGDDPFSLLNYQYRDECDHEWVLLSAYSNAREREGDRRVTASAKSYFVPNGHLDRLIELNATPENSGRNFPDVPSDYYLFAGEIPWSVAYDLDNKSARRAAVLKFEKIFSKRVVKKNRVAISRGIYELLEKCPDEIDELRAAEMFSDELKQALSKLRPFIKAINLDLSAEDQIDEALLSWSCPSDLDLERGYTELESFCYVGGVPITTTNRCYGWESYHSSLNDANGFHTPNAHFCLVTGLRSRFRAVELSDSAGIAATKVILGKSPDGSTEENLMYVRKDLLDQYLSSNKLSMVWHGWGERRMNYEYETSLEDKTGVYDVYAARDHEAEMLAVYRHAC